ATDPSEASGSFLCDASNGQWSGALLEALGLDRAKLPEIVDSWSVIGTVCKEVARPTRLAGFPGHEPAIGQRQLDPLRHRRRCRQVVSLVRRHLLPPRRGFPRAGEG